MNFEGKSLQQSHEMLILNKSYPCCCRRQRKVTLIYAIADYYRHPINIINTERENKERLFNSSTGTYIQLRTLLCVWLDGGNWPQYTISRIGLYSLSFIQITTQRPRVSSASDC